MADTATPQHPMQAQPVAQQPIIVANEGNTDDVNAPLLINGEGGEGTIEGNHNDPELSFQKTVLNLNNRNVRLTLWCIIYMIFTTGAWQFGTSQYIYYVDDWESDTYDPDTDTKEETFYSLWISTYSILWWAAAILLLNLFCICCNCKCSPISAALFVIGGIMQCVTVGDEIDMSCIDDADNDSNKVEVGYCKVTYIALFSWIMFFSFYLAIDTIYSIGNQINVRILVKASTLGITGFLWFLVQNHWLNQVSDSDHDYHSEKYTLDTLVSANFSLFFWSICCIIIVGMGYGNKNNPQKKLNIWIRRIIGWFIIGSTGASLTSGPGAISVFVFYTFLAYYIPGAALLAYDLQYV